MSKKNPMNKSIFAAASLIILLLFSIVYLHIVIDDNTSSSQRNGMVILMLLVIIASVFLFVSMRNVWKFNRNLEIEREKIRRSELRYGALFKLTSEGLWDMDPNYNMKYYSSDWYRNIGLDLDSNKLEAWSKFIDADGIESFNERLKEQIEGGQEYYLSEYKIKDIHGVEHWIEALGRAYFDDNGKLIHMSGVHRDITRKKSHEEEVLKLAYNDSLTGLPNRLKFSELVNKEINKGSEFGIIYLDIDNFKYINDNYGHNFGDQIIVALGKRLQKVAQSGDHICHLGSDEFVVVSKQYKDEKEIDGYVYYLLKELSRDYQIGKATINLTCSMGISTYPKNGSDFTQLLVNADIALYEAKEARNAYRFYDESMGKEVLDRANMESYLVKSIEHDELSVNYQPLIDLDSKAIKGFEALVRWHCDKVEGTYPDVFIPIAEQTGFIHQLGDFVMKEAIEFAAKLYDIYNRYYSISVNVSTIQLQDESLVSRVQELLVYYQLPAEYLTLEITESLELESNKKVLSRLSELRKLGVEIALDDFGTGYSSLTNLTSLSATQLKIDKSLTSQATSLQEVNKLIKGVVEFAHALDMKVVAEGVETKRMETIVNDLSIDYTQGYYYAKPIVSGKVNDFIDGYSKVNH